MPLFKVVKIILLLIIFHQVANAQIAIIRDNDGYTNVRSEASVNSKSIYQIQENELFWYNEDGRKGDWIPVIIAEDKFSYQAIYRTNISGYIHYSRICPLMNLEKVKNDVIVFQFNTASFDSSNFVIEKNIDGVVVAIDGRNVWGTDGGMPTLYVDSVSFRINGIIKDFPINLYNDLYQCKSDFIIYRNGSDFILYNENSDGAGYYELAYLISQNGQVKQRLVGSIY